MKIQSKNLQNPAPATVGLVFNDAFEIYTPDAKWSLNKDANDIVQLDGNACSASYLVISKDPFTQGSVTTLESVSAFTLPAEFIVGFGMSQRILGQELSIELVDAEDGTTIETYPDQAITSISQSGTTLTVTTSTPHELVAGKRVGIYGITSDSRLNYPSLVVSGVNNPNTFVCTAGPMGSLNSLTVGPYTNQGFVYFRPALGYAKDGLSMIYENAVATNASAYIRADAGDSYPSGTPGTNHSINTQTTNGVQAATYAYNYAWLPGNETRFYLSEERVIIHDAAPDTVSNTNIRLVRTQVLPNPNKSYKLRFRFTNNKGLTVPVAKIVSASKAGTTTATITTASAHGLTTGDFVITQGIRNGTDFPSNVVTQVLSTPTTTSFTITMTATTPTTTSYGGLVARVNGQNAPGSLNTNGNGAIQSVSVSSGEVSLTGSGTWSLVIGDYVNLYGCRNNTNGADLGLDGTYKVSESTGSALRLLPIGSTPTPGNLSNTSCGGAVIKRSDLRLSYVRGLRYERLKTEPNYVASATMSTPVIITGGTSNVSTVSTVSTVNVSNTNTSNLVNDIASAAITSTATSGTTTPSSGALSHEFNVIVTAVSGTSPTLDVVVQESDDSGTNWYDIYHFPRINATGQYRSPLIPFTGNRIRYVRTVGGTSPSFTMSLNRLQHQTANTLQRQFFDRALAPNTLNSVTGTLFTEGCSDINVFVSMGAVTTTAPTLVYETSPDGTNWVQVGANITTAANTNTILQISNVLARFSRIRVSSAGSGATLNFIMIKGIGR
jgi:hypothetical protein